jgi:hypothetical protein
VALGERLGPWALLRNRAFILFQARGTANSVGYSVYVGTILWLSYRLTGGILWSGVVIGVQTLVFTLTFLISPLVDRLYDKRWVFVACYPLQAALALVLGLTYSIGALTIPLLLVIVVFLAVLYDFTEAADETTTRLLFGRDHLFIVSGIASAIGGGVSMALYFTAGATLALFGAIGGAFLLSGLLAAGTALAVPLSIPTPTTTSQTWWNGLREGWALFRGTDGRPLRQLAVQQFVVGFFLAGPTLLLTLYVGQFFQGSQPTYAAFYVAYLIGGIVIGLLLGHTNPRGSIGAVTIGSMLVIGLALLGAEIAIASISVSTVVWFVVGAASTARNQSTWTYLQGRFEPQVLARVSMNIFLFTGVSSALGAFAIGAVSAAWSPQDITLLVGIGFIGSAGLGVVLQETRRLAF